MLVIIGTVLGADEKPAKADWKKEIQKYITQKTGRTARGTAVPKGSPWVWAIETYAAAKVLGEAGTPMNCKQLIETMAASGETGYRQRHDTPYPPTRLR
jgi:hypothetical protein